MKKIVFCAALAVFAAPLSLEAMGLGQMKVESFLDQPFRAEIELIDINRYPINSIQISLADPQSFERAGIVMSPELSLFKFRIERNQHGKMVISIQSSERITNPYIELIVDLAWPKGQIFKAYTILLDPPGYLVPVKQPRQYRVHQANNEPGVIETNATTSIHPNPFTTGDSRSKRVTYGPTLSNENVWQIAQRYKTSKVLLPQVVLSIVGANPEAFKNENLNGLVDGARLAIPSTQEIEQVPADLATEEVMAHDKAWNEKSNINHVITPPYMKAQTSQETSFQSKLPGIPELVQKEELNSGLMSQLIKTSSLVFTDKQTQQPQIQKTQSSEQEAVVKAQTSITTAAVESIRNSNSMLMEQVNQLQKQNKKLQEQLTKRDKDMEFIRKQLQIMMKERVALSSQASSTASTSNSTLFWTLLILLILVAGSGGFAWWYFKMREEKELKDESVNPIVPPVEPPVVTPKAEKEIPKTEKTEPVKAPPPPPILTAKEKIEPVVKTSEKKPVIKPKEEEKPVKVDTKKDNVMEFEHGLHELISQKPKQADKKSKDESEKKVEFKKVEEKKVEEKGVEKKVEEKQLEEKKVEEKPEADAKMDPSDDTTSPLKNKKAFDTLLALAKTYISMNDYESATHSLEEVLEHGSESQQKEAKLLLDEIKNR